MGPRQSEDICPRHGSRNYKESRQASPGGGGTSRAARPSRVEVTVTDEHCRWDRGVGSSWRKGSPGQDTGTKL